MGQSLIQLTLEDQSNFVLILRRKKLCYADVIRVANLRLKKMDKALTIDELMSLVTTNGPTVDTQRWQSILDVAVSMAPQEKRRYSPREDFLTTSPRSPRRSVLLKRYTIDHVPPAPL